METDQIIEISIESAQTYYRYLDQNGLGVQIVDVNELVNEGNILRIKLSNKLFDIEQIEFEIKKQKYTTNQIIPLEYDYEENILVIQPKLEYESNFSIINKEEIKVITDLKHLVKRVEHWYQENGKLVQLPNCKSAILPEIDIISNRIPTSEQEQAISLIFNEPFTYIWGAPGTGKTRYVLSYSVISYVKANRRIAVIAPTNNALEQVLYGVLEMIKCSGLKTECVIRMGTPSRKFAAEYPEVCETIGINKKIYELQNQIKILYRAKHLRLFYNRLSELKTDIIPKVEYIGFLNLEYKKMSDELKRLEEQVKIKQRIQGLVHTDAVQLLNQLDQLSKHMKSNFFKIRSFFSQELQLSSQKEYEKLSFLLKQKNYEYEKLELELAELVNIREIKNNKANELKNVNELIKAVKFKANMSPELFACVDKLSFWNYDFVLRELNQQVNSGEEFWKEQNKIYADYLSLSPEVIESKISELKKQAEELYNQSTKKRLKNVNVIAATIDTYIGRFKNSNETTYDDNIIIEKFSLDVDHIFMDEAGYCSLIKGTTLLANKCPITFLGDHMQLPPVCEMNDEKINQEKNNSVFLWAQSALMIEEMFYKSKEKLLQDYNIGQSPRFYKLKKCDLTKTHRFGSGLSTVLDRFVYKNGFGSLKDDVAFEFMVLNAKRSPGIRKRENPAEVNIIKDYIQTISSDDFIILTPYKDQVSLLRRVLPKLRDKIMTVHASQGREWNTVVLSVCDTSDKWFTDSCNKQSKGLMLINTAVSRAKKRLIIACDYDYWYRERNQLISNLIINKCR